MNKCSIESWIWETNKNFVITELASCAEYSFDSWDEDAINQGLINTDSESEKYFEYSFIGNQRIDVLIANEPDSDKLIFKVSCPEILKYKVSYILELATSYEINIYS